MRRLASGFGYALLVAAFTSPPAPKIERIHELKPEEGVFAYARISPDGRFLAYASQERDTPRPAPQGRTVTVVDLKTHQVTFTEPGIDAYWSNDGSRMIYLSAKSGAYGVTIRHNATGEITRGVAPSDLGDYYSWAVRDQKHLILTIQSVYYYLDGDRGVMPAGQVTSCPRIGMGERPLISKNGQRITTFVRGTIVVRGLTNCDDVIDTGVDGGKADFSWDGRYIATHVLKSNGRGYEIQVVDLQEKTVRTVTDLSGSSLFPSWLKDGRLFFNYDGADYRGFVIMSDFLSAPTRPLQAGRNSVPTRRTWSDLFPNTPRPAHKTNVVMVWSTWSAHSPEALVDLQRARDYFSANAADVSVATAIEPGTRAADAATMEARYHVQLPRVPLAHERFMLTEAKNQIPTTLLFRDGELVDRKLGAQTFEQLKTWVARAN